MFAELESLIADRTLVLTVSAVPGGAIRVNVIPKCLKENDTAEKALTTPLSMTGTAAELDRELPAQLASYTQTVLETSFTNTAASPDRGSTRILDQGTQKD